MERNEGPRALRDALRYRKLHELVDAIEHLRDPELAYYVAIVNGHDLDPERFMRLIRTIADHTIDGGEEYAFKLLRDDKALPSPVRDALLERVVVSGDKNTCNYVLRFIDRLGHWEQKLRDVLTSE